MALDPQLAALLATPADDTAPPASFADRRALFAAELAAIDRPGPAVAEERAITICARSRSLEARLFCPATPTPSNRPLMLFFHGGGWIQGSIATHASLCRYLSHHGGFDLLSVDYRLAPEHPFPAAFEDALDALRWLHEHGAGAGLGSSDIVIAGDSAGGNLAAAVCLAAPGEGLPSPQAALLLYPALDLANRTASRETFGRGYWLDTLDELIAHYVPAPSQRLTVEASPALATSLTGFPPTMMVTAGHDPLRDEGIAFTVRLMAEGGRCTLVNEAAMIHGFLSLHGMVPAAERRLIAIAEQFGRFVQPD
nr:alpha/beta hydrolase [Sphingomonas sp. Y57]